MPWYVTRSAALTAWTLLFGSVVWGVLLSTRLLGTRARPNWMLDLHRFLGGGGLLFALVHATALLFDEFVHFGIVDVLVPYASAWRPGAVALGVASLWGLAVVELTSLARRRLSKRVWHTIHLTSFGLFWTVSFHALNAGTDTASAAVRLLAYGAMTVVALLTLTRLRFLAPTKRSADRSGASARQLPVAAGQRTTLDSAAEDAL